MPIQGEAPCTVHDALLCVTFSCLLLIELRYVPGASESLLIL